MERVATDRHVPALDGVRGLAILAVLMSHFLPALADAFRTSWAREIVSYAGLGAWGVDLFFVLSGFLITGILLDTRDSPDYWRSFFGRRALRIFPLYYVFLIGLYVTNAPKGEAWTFVFHLSNWRTDLGISSNVLTWHFWSLAIEEQFYFVWPIVLGLLPARRVGTICLLIALTSVVARGIAAWSGAGIETLHRMTPLALDGLAIGSYLAWAVRHRQLQADRLTRFALPVGLGSAIAIYALGKINVPFAAVMVVGRAVVSIGGGALVLMAVAGPATVGRLLACRPLRVMGKYCYGLYLLHPIIVVKGITRTHWFATHLPSWMLPMAWFASLIGGLVASLVLARLSWRLIESPCLLLKRFFPYRPAQARLPSRPHFELNAVDPLNRRAMADEEASSAHAS
ncbi:MAG: acyltransferase family protein [Isosphaeraceae bacterium]